MTSAGVRVRRRPAPRVAGAVLVGLAGVVALAVVRARGSEVFPTDPVAALALWGGAVAAAVGGERLRDGGNSRAARLAWLLTLSLLCYLFAGLWAVLAWPGGGTAGTVAVAVWNTAWIPPLALVPLCASSAVRSGVSTPRTHVLVTVLLATLAADTLLFSEPTAPFAGLPTIADEAWRVALAPVGAAATLLGAVGLVLLPSRLWWAALTSHGSARARFGTAAAGATTAPLAVAFCVLLAVARDPGGIEPELGSVAFVVALAATAGVGVWCSVLAARSTIGTRQMAAVVRGVGLVAALLVVLAVGTLAVAPGTGLGATAAAFAVTVTTLVVAGLAWHGTGSLARALTAGHGVQHRATSRGEVTDGGEPEPEPEPEPALIDGPPDGASVPRSPVPSCLQSLTPRESEVLGLLAEGASNAGIAAELVVSDRTVDAHLRAIFHKLGLERDSVVNRRVRAARMWLDHTVGEVVPESR